MTNSTPIVRERSYNKNFDFRVKFFQAGAYMDPAAAGHFHIQKGDVCIALFPQKVIPVGVGSHFGQELSDPLKKFRYIFPQLIQNLRIIVTKKDPQTNTIPFLQNHYNYTINLKKIKGAFCHNRQNPLLLQQGCAAEGGALYRERSGVSPYTRYTHRRAPRRSRGSPRSSTSRR